MSRAVSIAVVALLAGGGCGRSLPPAAPTAQPGMIPQPASSVRIGPGFELRAPVSVNTEGPGAERLRAALRDWMAKQASYLGTPFEFAADDERAQITINVGAAIPGDESYRLEAAAAQVRIDAASPSGAFYGLQSLRQLLSVDELRRVRVQAVRIDDAPRFPYRGMHLDVGRHFFPTEFVKRYVDLLASYKMNHFHWHLTEDQGWRIQIDAYPRLTSIGSCRAETIVERNFDPYVGDGQPYCGFYSKDEIREVVAYAADRFVTVIPEIEMPGHSLAALAAYPSLSCDGGPFEVGTRWGVYEDIYCPSEQTFAFLESVLDEVLELFPSEYIHIGGDEAPKRSWEASPLAQEVIRREGLADEHELQSYFIRRIEAFLNERGRKLIGWDEILEGGLAPDATVMSWRGTAGGIAAARQGHDVIMTPTSHMYFDYYQGDPAHEPLAIGGFLPLQRVYAFDPVPDVLTDSEAVHILGGQGNVWTEYMTTPGRVEYMAYPRAIALAEVLWSPRPARDWGSFTARLPRELRRLDRLAVNYRLPDITGLENDRLTLEPLVAIELGAPLSNARIHYTLDGTDPDSTSPQYMDPFTLDLTEGPVAVRARAFLSDGRATAPAMATFRHATLQDPDLGPSTDLAPGLLRTYYEGTFETVDELRVASPTATSAAAVLALSGSERPERFGLVFDGYVNVPEDGVYEFELASDDGSRLTIGSEIVVDHDGLHGMSARTGQIALRQGLHSLHLSFFQAGGGVGLALRVRPPGALGMVDIPPAWLVHVTNGLR
ncbi:MAG: family 20 glycosylhydrolase [Gemmatimonadota bacterium]